MVLIMLLCLSPLSAPSAFALSAKMPGSDTALSRLPYELIRALYILEQDHRTLPDTVVLETMKEKPKRFRLERKESNNPKYYDYTLELFDGQGWALQEKVKIIITEEPAYINVSNLYLNEDFADFSLLEEGIGTVLLLYFARYAQLKGKALTLGTENYALLEMIRAKISKNLLCKCEALDFAYAPYDAFPLRHFLSEWTADGGGATILIHNPTIMLENVFVAWGEKKIVQAGRDQYWVAVEGRQDGRIAVSAARHQAGPYTPVKAYIKMPFLVNIWIKPEDIFAGVATWDTLLDLAEKIAARGKKKAEGKLLQGNTNVQEVLASLVLRDNRNQRYRLEVHKGFSGTDEHGRLSGRAAPTPIEWLRSSVWDYYWCRVITEKNEPTDAYVQLRIHRFKRARVFIEYLHFGTLAQRGLGTSLAAQMLDHIPDLQLISSPYEPAMIINLLEHAGFNDNRLSFYGVPLKKKPSFFLTVHLTSKRIEEISCGNAFLQSC